VNVLPQLAVLESSPKGTLDAGFAKSVAEIRQAQRLRYDVFAREMGARLHAQLPGLDYDHFDRFCHHLLVRDLASGRVVGYTRLLTGEQARAAGGFYSETEFDIAPVLKLPGRFLELGRTCIHPDYRSGATIATLWAAIADFVAAQGVDYLIGCPSIPLGNNCREAHAIYALLRRRYLSEESLRVVPRIPLPPAPSLSTDPAVTLPPLMKAYLRVGARVCGEPFLDADFQVADLFILLPVQALERRYARHFLGQSACH
jgi:putative hemolysin